MYFQRSMRDDDRSDRSYSCTRVSPSPRHNQYVPHTLTQFSRRNCSRAAAFCSNRYGENDSFTKLGISWVGTKR